MIPGAPAVDQPPAAASDAPATPCRHISARVAAQPPFRKAAEEGWLNLSSNELHHPGLGAIFDTFFERRRNLPDLSRYPRFDAAHRRLEAELAMPPGACLLSPGADLAIRAVMEAFGASGRFVCPVPCYRAYADYAAAFGLDMIGVEQDPDDGGTAFERLLEAIERASPCLVAVADPDGTTGRRLSDDELGRMERVVARGGSLLVRDEAYLAFATRDDVPGIRQEARTITIRTLSKSHGTAGLRLALVVGPPALVDALARTRVANGLSRIAIEFLLFSLAERSRFRSLVADVADMRDRLRSALREADAMCRIEASEANFLFLNLGSPAAADGFARALAAERIRARFFADIPAFSGCARLAVPPPGDIDRVVSCLRIVSR